MTAGPAVSPGSASPALVFENLMAFQRTAALRAAIELDLFRAVGEGPGDVTSLAKRCGASARGIRILCDFLTINGLLGKEGVCYTHNETSARFLDPRSPMCVARTAGFLSAPKVTEPYKRLTEVVRTGRTVLDGDGTVEPDHPVWVEFAHSMAPMMRPMAGPLGTIVLHEKSGPMRVLDIAAGHGLFGIEVARQNADARIVALDWPAVLEVAKENARKARVDTRYELLPGNAFGVDFQGPYDVVLLTNFLHHFDPSTCISLLKKVRGSLKPGGMSATLEFVPNEDRVSPPMAAAFAMTMLATTVSGDAYTFKELEQMHVDAGFRDIRQHPVPTGPHTVVTARAA
jgi:2-polyprenyl-3-methyl-5-hydroxy-6-metoxy-1,4-benzoquinol methylase